MSIKNEIFDTLKNVYGWKTKRKIIVFSIDDYGNVRLGSKLAFNNIKKNGIQENSRFDRYDALETSDDLLMLFDVLTSVKDINGNFPVFTCYALPCNLDFEAILKSNFEEYCYESLPITFEKLSQLHPYYYDKTWSIWQEGVKVKLLSPEFHGREHVSIEEFKYQVKNNYKLIKLLFENRTFSFLPALTGYRSYTAAFSFNNISETANFEYIIKTGLQEFEKVYNKKATIFTPPAQQFPPHLLPNLQKYGIKAIDRPFYSKVHLGEGNFKRTLSATRYNAKSNIFNIVRNVVFEPSDDNPYNSVSHAMTQIAKAFQCNRVANISSHRINFCGLISEKNRKAGLENLQLLLNEIIKKWPDVEFISASDLIDIISKEK